MEEERKEELVENKKKNKKNKRPFDVTVKIYKIVSIVLYCIWTAFFAYILISARLDVENSNDAGKAFGFIFLIIIMAAVGLIGYGIMTFIGIAGLSLSIANKDNPKRKGNISFFAIEAVVSVGTFFVVFYLSLLQL